ncbi:hypothetical protein Tsubulata_014905 [Turnera subulata]|uniref:Uncharacterized protein n=1 Tax=Turnera subulata TaxID=218843 RepID=A0A9Q0JI73_9ROSI|nr:hypothetical protein Tsubulata_014905 [Turnera subulata]
MAEISRAPASSPLPSVDDIQKRLLRPSSTVPSPSTQPPSKEAVPGRNRSPLKENLEQLSAKQEADESGAATKKKKKKKLEDYLDPVLLSAISAKIGGARKEAAGKVKREARDFDWPVHDLKVFVEGEEKGGDSGREGKVEFCTPFERFEETALKRFKW